MKTLVAIWIALVNPAVGTSPLPGDGQVALERLDALYAAMRESESMHIEMVICAFDVQGEPLEDFPMTYRIDVCGSRLSYQSEGFCMVQDEHRSLQIHDQARQLIYRHLTSSPTPTAKSTVEEILPVSVQAWSKTCDSVRARTTLSGDNQITFYYPSGPWVTATVTVDGSFTKLLRADAVGRGESPPIAHYTVEFPRCSYACEAPRGAFDFSRYVSGQGFGARPTSQYADYDFVNLTPR